MGLETREMNDARPERCTPRPDRSELADVLHQHGAAEGFSFEWVVDRYFQSEGGRI